MNKKALITGVTGQDGSYLSELLLSKGYKVYGLKRRSSLNNNARIKHLLSNENFNLIEGDVTDSVSIFSVVKNVSPDEIYNLAAQSHVATSFKQPDYTFQVNALGVLNLLEAIRAHRPDIRFYQASTSEMFGRNYSVLDDEKIQNEETQFSPQSPYAVAKVAAHELVGLYRRAYDLHASCGVLFNHESCRRGEEFVTRKITKWIGEFYPWYTAIDGQLHDNYSDPDYILKKSPVYLGGDNSIIDRFPKLRLGNIDSYRDWGHAKDYVKAMHLMLQQETADDYIVATGESYSVKDFLSSAFKEIGIDNYKDFIVIDPKFYRPAEVDFLRGDASRAKSSLGWSIETSFEELVKSMVNADMQ